MILSLGAHFHAWYDGLGAFWFVVYFFSVPKTMSCPKIDPEHARVKA